MHVRTAVLARNAACLLTLGCAMHLLHAQGGAALQVHTAGDQTTFRIGERIPLELRFTAPAEANLLLNNARYDRSGRMMHEAFTVTPGGGWTDPLKTYFGSFGGFAGGGAFGMTRLSPQPAVVAIDLNEWVRFDQPGDYRVTVSSDRVADPAQKQSSFGTGSSITAAPLLLHIVPATEAWQAERLKVIRAALSKTEANTNAPSEARRQVLADLRYLGSRAAVDVLADNLREDRPDALYESGFGLIGLPQSMRDNAVAALQHRIDDPQFPLCSWLLDTLSVLGVNGSDDPERQRPVRTRAHDDAWREALRALERKQGAARAATTQTLLSQPPRDLDADTRRQLGTVMAASLANLPEDKRAQELQWYWDDLQSPSILPALKSDSKLPLDDPGSNRSDLYTRRGLKTIALARWYELDPAGATQEALAQIGSAHPSLTAESLYFLPKQQLPQFEPLWAQAFAAETNYEQKTVLAALLVRFGSGAATGTVAARLQQEVGKSPCTSQAAALAYMLKFDPDEARPLLQNAADAQGTGMTRCYESLFQEVSRFAAGPVLNDVALSALDSPNQRQVMDALIYLMAYGRKQDRPTLWEHFAAWHERFQGKGEALDGNGLNASEENYLGRAVGENLSRALIANQGWLAEPELLQRVLAMCVGQQMCDQMQQLAQQTQSRDVTLYRDGGSENLQIAQYTSHSFDLFGQKVAQYPKGTSFRLRTSYSRTGAQKALEAEARKVFEDQGMTLVEELPPSSHRFADR